MTTQLPTTTCCNCGTTTARQWHLHDGRWVCADCWWPVGRPT